MKYFLCALGGAPSAADAQNEQTPSVVYLSIPTTHTERIIPVTKTQTTESETENGEVFVSLPVLFRQENIATPHGIVLRTEQVPKTVLLTPRVERDVEIPEESIRPLPGIFARMSKYFKGLYFDKQNLFLILNTEKFMEGKND